MQAPDIFLPSEQTNCVTGKHEQSEAKHLSSGKECILVRENFSSFGYNLTEVRSYI